MTPGKFFLLTLHLLGRVCTIESKDLGRVALIADTRWLKLLHSVSKICDVVALNGPLQPVKRAPKDELPPTPFSPLLQRTLD